MCPKSWVITSTQESSFSARCVVDLDIYRFFYDSTQSDGEHSNYDTDTLIYSHSIYVFAGGWFKQRKIWAKFYKWQQCRKREDRSFEVTIVSAFQREVTWAWFWVIKKGMKRTAGGRNSMSRGWERNMSRASLD